MGELARIKQDSKPPTFTTAVPIKSLAGLAFINPGDNIGMDCVPRAVAALQFCPTARIVAGSVILRGGRCLRTGRSVHSCKPWGHHVWLVEGTRGFHDPSIENLALWADSQDIELPRPWQEMEAWVARTPKVQREIVRTMRTCRRRLPADLIYLPGMVFSLPEEEVQHDPTYIRAWDQLARASVEAGGFTADQFEDAAARFLRR